MKSRILFIGTTDFAVKSLLELIYKKYKVVAVITSPDKKSGRGLKMSPSPVKLCAQKNKIKIFQPDDLINTDFLNTIKGLKPEIGVVVAFRFLPKALWSIPKLGTFNLHGSLLPNLRGAAPINWAIILNEKVTGVTTFLIDEKIDTGKILLQESLPLSKFETAKSLHDKLAILGKNIVIQTIKSLLSGIVPKIQILTGKEKTAPKLNKNNTKINWSSNLFEIESFIRGMSPLPGAWSYLKDGKETIVIKLFKVKIFNENENKHNLVVTSDKKNLLIHHHQGLLKVEILQFPNKKRMDSKSFLNGFKLKTGTKVF